MLRNPNIVVSSAGIFHAYHLARGVQAAGYLQKFITSVFNKYESGIDKNKITQIQLAAVCAALIRVFPGTTGRLASYLIGDDIYDRLAANYVKEADIVHVFNNQGLQCLKVAKNNRAITVVSRSSAHPNIQAEILSLDVRENKLSRKINKLLIERHLAEYELADYIFVPSQFVWDTMLQEGVPERKLRRVHLGFDPGRFYPGDKQDNVFRIMYAGGLSKQKGISYLLEAYKELDLPNSELLLVGDEYPDAKEIIATYKGLFRHIRFVPQEKLVHYYQQASVFVLPSLQDGFGMVVYEAAGCGIPLIITENVGADIRDEEDGFVVPIRDSKSIAAKLMYLYQNPRIAREMGLAARQYVKQFTWENYHHELKRHYDEIWNEQLL
jgi:glycosyltransferase involved in cell wall biosynthesis